MGYNKEKCKHLCGQLKRYKDKRFPFNIPYDDNYETPDLWWNIIDGYDELKQLALKLFAIMPNSASCERGFSKLGWLSGKYRINLSTQSLESLAKMSSYYLSNLKKELIYYGQNISTEEITEIIHSLDFNEIEEADKDSNFEDSNIINDKSNDNVEVIIEWHPLQLENFIDLNNPIITKDLDIIQDDSDTDLSNEESENSQNTNSNNSDNESESNSESEDYNYNPNEIAKDIYNNDDITDDNYTCKGKLVDLRTKKNHAKRKNTPQREFTFESLETSHNSITSDLEDFTDIDAEYDHDPQEESYQFLVKRKPVDSQKNRTSVTSHLEVVSELFSDDDDKPEEDNEFEEEFDLSSSDDESEKDCQVDFTVPEIKVEQDNFVQSEDLDDNFSNDPNITPKFTKCIFQDFPNHSKSYGRKPCETPLYKISARRMV
ncbi:unnamed protein product [Rhizophagus irregularis]|uniref:HAT C-terminal dimerisation domain-containing protein n=1 Tax=Rhizophagus irregularis TaxID=588596 RepID=A0A915Z1N0_9GLOM|nr:unnamed protein product [Rhizophagus irregularis]